MIGTTLQNRYRLDAVLGQGGMGVVYSAHDTLLDRAVAVKVVSKASLGTEGRARLMNEAKAAAQLNHPNVVSIYDAGESDGVPFIVMELVEGDTLYQRRPTELDEIVSYVRQICAALEHAHAHGIVHRDLKPENVQIALDGTAKLTDFGLARSVASRMTSEGTIIGSVFYLAQSPFYNDPADHEDHLFGVNTTGAVKAAEAARKAAARFFCYASTGNVYQPSFEPPRPRLRFAVRPATRAFRHRRHRHSVRNRSGCSCGTVHAARRA